MCAWEEKRVGYRQIKEFLNSQVDGKRKQINKENKNQHSL